MNMENLKEEIENLAKQHNKKIDSKSLDTIISMLNLSDTIHDFAEQLKNDPDSLYNNMNDEIELILITNRENYQKSFKIAVNIHDAKDDNFIKYHEFIYQLISLTLSNDSFSEGLAHFYSLNICRDLMVNEANELASGFSIDYLSSFSDNELESLKLKSKLTFSLIQLATNKNFTSNRTEKLIESIELSKQIKSLSDKSITSLSNSELNVNDKDNKAETLKSSMFSNGFYELTKVNSLSHDSQLKLIELIKLNDTPYNVALFDYIGFFKYLENEKSFTKVTIHKKISAIFECSADTIKGNMLSLNDYSKIDKTRYTAHLHKEKVKNDYNSLK